MSDLTDLKRWAFDVLKGWGTLEPADGEKAEKFRTWTLAEIKAKADELVIWLRTEPKKSEPGDSQ